MAHFAELDENNNVLRVIVVNNDVLLDSNNIEKEELGILFCESLFGGRWIQTSYNKKFRKNFAGPGCVYDPIRDAFITQKLYESWILNEDTLNYDPPFPKPEDGNLYYWDENSTSWLLLLPSN